MSSSKPRRSPRKAAQQQAQDDNISETEKPITTLSRELKNIARGLVEIPKLREHPPKASPDSESEEYGPEHQAASVVVITSPTRRSVRVAAAANNNSKVEATEIKLTSSTKSPSKKKRKRSEEGEPTTTKPAATDETQQPPSQTEDTDPEPMGSPSEAKPEEDPASPSKRRSRKSKVDPEYTEGKAESEAAESSSSPSVSGDEAEPSAQRGRSPTKKRRKMSSEEQVETLKHPFADNDIYDDADEDSAVEPQSAVDSASTPMPVQPEAGATAVRTELPIPKIIKTSPPPSPTKKQLSAPVKHLPTHDTAVQIHDRPKVASLTMSSFLNEVQERSSTSTEKTSSPQKMPPPTMPPHSIVAPKRTLLPMPEEQQSQDSMILLEIESSQDGSRSPSPGPPNFISSLAPSEDAQF